VTVLSIGRDHVRLGIEAPPEVQVHREEVYRAIQEANRAAAATPGDEAALAEVARAAWGEQGAAAPSEPAPPAASSHVEAPTKGSATP
jgi:carbon storage regulator